MPLIIDRCDEIHQCTMEENTADVRVNVYGTVRDSGDLRTGSHQKGDKGHLGDRGKKSDKK